MLGECRETAIECRHRELIYIYIYMCVCVFEINAFSIITPFPLYYFEWGAIILIVKSGPLRLPSACQSNPAHRCRDACRPEDRHAVYFGSLKCSLCAYCKTIGTSFCLSAPVKSFCSMRRFLLQ